MNRYFAFFGAILSGLCLYFAVLHTVFILSWVALVPVVVAAHRTVRRSYALFFLAAFTFSVGAFSWMIPGAHSFTGGPLVYGIAVFGVCVLIFAFGLASLLWVCTRTASGAVSTMSDAFFAASVWVLAEALLQWAARGMPWFLFHLGNGLADNLYAIQPVSVTGVYGVSWIVACVNFLVARAIALRHWKKIFLPIILFASYMTAGWLLLWSFERTEPQGSFSVSILNENIPPETQWDQSNGRQLVSQLLEAERTAIAARPAMILWPESAIPWTWSPDDDLVRELLRHSDPANITHILGMNTAVRTAVVGNSAYCILPGGQLAGRYDKKTPLLLIEQPWHSWLIPFVSADGYSVAPGISDVPLKTPYGNAGILICNESTLPDAAAATVSRGAQWLFNLSNDGWFRDNYLVRLHFSNARLRAVETRKDIAINSNNGISGLVSASGRIDGSDLVTIHPNRLLTTAVQYPNWPIYLCGLVSLIILIINKTTLQ
ncbi:apolipoprotein N-acyltransferase [Flavitalea sp. BT771]|uniref:apolipoprotein N-acyltransferase n=1 Tax=Flavitalea sp. BT771 TaxID=3063329 RepID=UPI0026E355CB|nr:apolipoprotein N-acyltransferase [Flavitalea sp. BT771]MDO6429938.1 apolipoprotein N-acyltransferase [Flavitalea sp. BT771]MDV6217934.1 apolipoprotein N-acyltransferase [Flavitalea sp. BT771]